MPRNQFPDGSFDPGGSAHQLRLAEQILRLLDRGLPTDPSVAGFHGTNLSAISGLIRNGALPAGAEVGNIRKHGFIHFIANEAAGANFGLDIQYAPVNQALQVAQSYATLSSARTFVLAQLGLDTSNELHCSFAEDLLTAPIEKVILMKDYEEIVRDLLSRKVDLQKCLIGAREQKGVVLALSSEIFRGYEFSLGDDPEIGNVRIYTPQGLPLQHIAGLAALGPEEQKFFNKLKAKIV